MTNINEIVNGKALGYKCTANYIWLGCTQCNKPRWVRLTQGKPNRLICRECSCKLTGLKSRGKTVIHAKTQKVIETGLKECTKCHNLLPANSDYFVRRNTKLKIGSICKSCSSKKAKEKLESLGKIEISCSVCGRKELVYNTGKTKSICGGCSQKLSGKQKLPRGKYDYKSVKTAICSFCKKELPATNEFFKKSKVTKSGLCLGRCKNCVNKIAQKRTLSTIKGKLSKRVSNYMRQTLKGNKDYKHWEDIVGYTIKDLMRHLERKFKLGMTWDNYGKWHIDHIIPVSAFSYTSIDDIDFKRCWALKNLQPLWHWENESKGVKIKDGFQPSLK